MQLEGMPAKANTARRLLIGPANSAGQGFAWAEAVSTLVPDATGHSFRSGAESRPFPVHYRVDEATFRRDKRWRRDFTAAVLDNYTHVLFEAGRPLLGSQGGTTARHDVRRCRDAGISVGMLVHGSEVRLPSLHEVREPWAQFQHMDPDFVHVLEKKALMTLAWLREFNGPVFASTLGLLDFVPWAQWCPVVVDGETWQSDTPVLEAELPVVAHVPSSQQKGSEWIDPILRELDDRGVISYLRASDVQHHEMPALIASCDVMVEQFGIADYSVAACEAMAAGRVVVSHVADPVRHRVEQMTGRSLPIVEADPSTLATVIEKVIDDRAGSRDIASRGPSFVREIHNGRRSAAALATMLDA